MTIGQKIKRIRESKNISQRELGELLSKSQGTVAKYENDLAEMDYATLNAFCDYANCSIDYLLGRVDYPELVVKKTPPEGGADSIEYHIDKDAPELTPDEILKIKEFLKDQERLSGE